MSVSPPSEQFKVEDLSQKRYFTRIPNVVFDIKMPHTAFRLYCWYRRICGGRQDEGSCWMSIENIGKSCQMDRRTIITTRDKLEELGLIAVQHDRTNNGSTRVIVTLEDIWDKNEEYFSDVQRNNSGESKICTKEQLATVQKNNSIKNSINKNNKMSPPSGGDLSPRQISTKNGFTLNGDKKANKPPQHEQALPFAKTLAAAVEKNFKSYHKSKLKDWAHQFHLLLTKDEADPEQVIEVLEWYIAADWTDKYLPKAYSGYSFRTKFFEKLIPAHVLSLSGNGSTRHDRIVAGFKEMHENARETEAADRERRNRIFEENYGN